nr:immunoglobulin heavy chain junction region [Macaca mulatta]MOV41387.1 immunoglobulin heavy chain junction region [Macaca mulatta]MOV41634.1 immunoglobulin heavy chain junction region [Macaca mulatta]MOV42881.1 immunoglobulin heavy chain junction region [Macaca mulatta]MOV43356.1 immunoglobulin heavy chain junction region [Macaca mulatta]
CARHYNILTGHYNSLDVW